jgi:acetyl-CoA carboxylase biotin carboxyl carrier protein
MAAKKPPASAPEIDLVRALAQVLSDTNLAEIEFEQKGTRVRVSRGGAVVAAAPPPMPAAGLASVAAPAAAEAPPTAELDARANPNAVKSPMVGTVYLAAAPGAAPFITLGAEVKAGQTLLIVEAMKTMNQIPSPRAGKVTQILVENGQPVEYGEPLAVIE